VKVTIQNVTLDFTIVKRFKYVCSVTHLPYSILLAWCICRCPGMQGNGHQWSWIGELDGMGWLVFGNWSFVTWKWSFMILTWSLKS